jgi:transcriptional regulator with XRE-family HTH domain
MSEQPAEGGLIPVWDTADRMRKALRVAGVSVYDMADYLQVDRSTISNWTSGRIEPSAGNLRLWALKTGVPFTWLCHGDMQPCDLRPKGIPVGTSDRSAVKMQRLQTYEVA